MRSAARSALIAWCVLSALVLASLFVIQLRSGAAGFAYFIQQWALSNLTVTLASTALTWLLLGALLFFLDRGEITPANALSVAALFILLFLYLNVLRERFRYGDYAYYIEAATAMREGRALPDTYLYMPLWAALLQFIVPWGDQGVLLILWTLNVFALAAFYVLLHRLLQRYGFSARLAALTAFIFTLVNVPILRTLGFVQVNLLVMDLIFAAMLQYPRWPWLSAVCLALAVHLKTSPAVLILAFLLEKDWRWLARFAVAFLAIAVIPMLTNGFGPYLDYVNNLYGLTQLTDTNFHENSIDSFARFAGPFLGLTLPAIRLIVYALKLALIAATLVVVARNLRNRTFADGADRGAGMLNTAPALFVLMTLLPPIVWDHHGIFVALPALLLFGRISARAAWSWYAFAYSLQFLLPSFDFFPWSYGRLVAPLILLALCWSVSPSSKAADALNAAERWLAALPGSGPRAGFA